MLLRNRLTEEQRLTKAVVAIMGNPKYTALAGVLMIGDRNVVDDPNVPTACTNGRDEMYGRGFVNELNDAQLRFLVLHEVYHKLFKHMTTWHHLFKQDAQLANMACDYVINLKIVDDNKDGFATMTGILEGGCYDRKYVGMDSAQVYNLLREDQDGQGSEQGEGEGDSGQGSGSLHNGQQPFDEHDWEGAQELTADEQRELARELDEAVRQGALAAGKMGSGVRPCESLSRPHVQVATTLHTAAPTADTCRRVYTCQAVSVSKSGNWYWLSTRRDQSASANCLRF